MSALLHTAGEAFGDVVRVRRAGDFVLRLSRYAPDLRVEPHHHPLAYFSYVTDGSLHERAGTKERHYGPASLHFHPAEDAHEIATGAEGLTVLSITPGEALAEHTSLARADERVAAVLVPLAARCKRAFSSDVLGWELSLEASALELVAALVRAERHERHAVRPPWLAGVREYLELHYAEPISLGEIAARARVHPVHLVRVFRRHEGVPPGAYLRRLRLEAARRALAASERPIAEIALDAGFASQSHLTRLFHRELGMTPAAYRRAERRRRPAQASSVTRAHGVKDAPRRAR